VKLESLHQLYLHELKDMYNGEQQVLKALPKMAKNASSPELRAAFEDHLEQTRGHVDRLEQIFQKLEEPAKGQKCKGIERIIAEGEEMMEDEDAPPAVADAAMIGAAQRVEHHEMAAYGTARNYARRLGFEDQTRLLQQTLQEEIETDRKLTTIADSYINEEAKSAR
jgi:ferritin-like metal-binding protein YciE